MLSIHLPGIDGLEIVPLLRKEWPDAFIIVLNYDFPDRDGAIEVGANFFCQRKK
ncbi:MAG: hypothetical protein R2861_16875 [Desulfobacterales bacterium]